MPEFSTTEKTILVQYGIKKYENEETVFEKLKTIMSEKDIQRNIDTLIATATLRNGIFLVHSNCKLILSYST